MLNLNNADGTLLHIDWKSTGALEPGLRELIKHLPVRFAEAETARSVSFYSDAGMKGFRLVDKADRIEIHYAQKSDAFRALGAIAAAGGNPGSLEESCSFSSLGVMLDVSRNGVLKVESIKKFFRHFALMGINAVHLYMEDVYEIEGEPFFGYARGAYTKEELREIDQYGDALGIEVIPCIQTLGHMAQILQWPAYSDLGDTPGVMLAEEPKTYRLIEKMFETLASCFRTKRIHIGMDEAFGIGQGAYRRIHGERRPFDVLTIHLNRVVELCEKMGLHPMIWSDMYFRIGSAMHDYYDRNACIPDDIAGKIPSGVDLVYWDYYHTDSAFYSEWIARHRALGKEPVFAAGIWNWGRFWTHYPHAFATIKAGMKAAREQHLKEAMVTVWGDDGTECNPLSILPAVQYFVENAYFSEVTPEHLARRFSCLSEGNIEDWLLGAELDAFPGARSIGNYGKWILWHDPLLNFLEKEIPEILPSHYKTLAAKLEEKIGCDEPSIHFQWLAKLAGALAMKSQLHQEVGRFYRDQNIEGLRFHLSQLIPATLEALRLLKRFHRSIWDEWYKPFGWDVIERRYAGVISRMETLQEKLSHYLEDPTIQIPELEKEAERLYPPGVNGEDFFVHARSSSATTER